MYLTRFQLLHFKHSSVSDFGTGAADPHLLLPIAIPRFGKNELVKEIFRLFTNSMLFAHFLPFRALEPGPEFYNNMNASKNSRGPENDEAAFYNNMAASRNQAGPESDEVSTACLPTNWIWCSAC